MNRHHRLLQRQRAFRPHYRLFLAIRAHRIERRIGRYLTDAELDRISFIGDPLLLREMWLRYGGHLEVREGHLCLSSTLPCQRKS